MANPMINPMSFMPRIVVSEEFVTQMIDLYLELEVRHKETKKGGNKQEFNDWYKEQVLLFGTDPESQGLRDLISDDARELFRRWYA